MDKYKVVMRVEIVGHSDGFWNSYYGAKVLRVDQTKLRVIYEELIDDDEGDDVDVYDQDGWWRGEVVFEFDDELMVYFSYMKDNDSESHDTFPYDDVHIHQEVKEVGKGFAWSHVKIAGSK
ncbi:hypothetical protein LXL04_000642 [Taraxacum kok-saghyz]